MRSNLQNKDRLYSVTRATEAEELWSAAQTDAQLLARLRAGYAGRHDVLDALWWASHPLATSPRRVPDPASQLASLQAAVFSRQNETEPLIEVSSRDTGYSVRMTRPEHRLRALLDELADDETALDAVLERMRGRPAADVATAVLTDTAAPTDTAVPTDTAAPTDTAPAAPPGSPPESFPTAHPPARQRKRWRTSVLVAIGACAGIAAGLVAGMWMKGALDQPGDGTAAVENLFAAFESTAAPQSAGSTSDVLQVFDQSAGLPGGESLNLGRGFINESIRSVFGTVRQPGGYGVYAVQRETDDYCLVILDGYQGISSACASLRVLQQNGLWLMSRVVAKFPGNDNPHSPLYVDVAVRWSPDGTFSQHAVPSH